MYIFFCRTAFERLNAHLFAFPLNCRGSRPHPRSIHPGLIFQRSLLNTGVQQLLSLSPLTHKPVVVPVYSFLCPILVTSLTVFDLSDFLLSINSSSAIYP